MSTDVEYAGSEVDILQCNMQNSQFYMCFNSYKKYWNLAIC